MGEGQRFLKLPFREKKVLAQLPSSLDLRDFFPWGKAS